MSLLLALVLCLLPLPLSAAAPVDIKGVRLSATPDQVRLVLDTNGELAHKIFALSNPDRLVIDIAQARLQTSLPRPEGESPLLEGLRSAPLGGNDLRLVLDLKRAVRAKSFMLKADDQGNSRLVIEIGARGQEPRSNIPPAPNRTDEPKEPPAKKPEAVPQAQAKPAPAAKKGARELVIAIDAGHGGEDPGAIGPAGTQEKDVVLAVARELFALVRKEPGMRPVLIRDGDYFVSLGKRVDKARRQQADLFVSIHADAFENDRVSGSSVYTLSQRGASSEAARWLAERENRADLVGGIDLEDRDSLLASVLLDLSQSATLEASGQAADRMLASLAKVGEVHKSGVQHAGFVVLKSPDVPSLLVELAFISNPEEERRLSNPRQQQRFAAALLKGIRDHFKGYRPPNTRTAGTATGETRKHVIARGETLSEIAEQYAVSLSELRRLNRLADDQVRIGQTLTIPGG